MDVVLEFRSGQTWVAEIKRSSVSEGRYTISTDLGATRRLLVAPVNQPYLPYERENRSRVEELSEALDLNSHRSVIGVRIAQELHGVGNLLVGVYSVKAMRAWSSMATN